MSAVWPLGDFAAELAAWWAAAGSRHEAFLAERAGVATGMAWLAMLERVPGPESFVRRAGVVQSVYGDFVPHGVSLRIAVQQ